MASKTKIRNQALQDKDLDAWVKSVEPTGGCRTCSSTSSDTIRRLVTAMANSDGHSITQQKLFDKVRQLHPEYTIKIFGFRDHLYKCLPDLWKKASRSKRG